MNIAAFQPESFIDYPEKISVVVFSPSCTFRCPSCHAKNILNSSERISEEEFFEYLESKKDWLEAVVLCGGEPTLEPDLIEFIEKIKKFGFLVKLDTNGSNPKVLSDLKERKLVDYIAMDVKAPKELYNNVSGTKASNLNKTIEESIKIISQFPDYEFRTTIVPIFRNSHITFMTPEEVDKIVKWILNVTNKNSHKYFLQRSVARKNELLDKRMEEFSETPEDLLKQIHTKVLKLLPNTKLR